MRYLCTKCGKMKEERDFHLRLSINPYKRQVAYNCKECRKLRDRSDEVWKNAYNKRQTICASCNKPKKLITDICSKCLAERGFKKCNKCNETKLLHLSFYDNKNICIDCIKKKPVVKPALKKQTGLSDLIKNAQLHMKAVLIYLEAAQILQGRILQAPE